MFFFSISFQINLLINILQRNNDDCPAHCPSPSLASVSRGWLFRHFHSPTPAPTSLACKCKSGVGFLNCISASKTTHPPCSQTRVGVGWFLFSWPHSTTPP